MTAARQRPSSWRDLPTRISRTTHLVGRFLLTAVVRRLPPAGIAPLRRPAQPLERFATMRHLAREVLRRGGVPRAVRAFSLADNPTVRFLNADSLVVQQLFWFGERGWEPELLPWWRQACQHASKVVELGANVGYYAVQGGMAAPHARYLAVEPHPASARLCRENLALNGINSVEVLTAAATADPTQSRTDLVIPWEQLGAPTVAFMAGGSELPPRMANRAATTISVSTVDVRSLLDGVDLLKMDVEGQEHSLLAAGWHQLSRYLPTIVVEVLPGTPQLRAILVRLCTELGYQCFVPHQDRLVPVPPQRLPTIQLQHEHGTNDLLLYAEHKGVRVDTPLERRSAIRAHVFDSSTTVPCLRRALNHGVRSETGHTYGRSSGRSSPNSGR